MSDVSDVSNAGKAWQYGIAIFILGLGIVYGIGAAAFPSEGGYAGIGPNFVPILIAVALGVTGAILLWQVATGGLRNFTDELAGVTANYRGGLWLTTGVLLHALLITHIGFVLASTLLFVCVARGFGSKRWWLDAIYGTALVLPVFWLFTMVLDVSLPQLFNDWI